MIPNPKLDRIGKICNWILGILYFPLSFVSFIATMVIEYTMGATNPVFIALIRFISGLFFFDMFFCLFAIPIARMMKNRGHSRLSIFISFLPLLLFLLNIGLLVLASFVPAVA